MGFYKKIGPNRSLPRRIMMKNQAASKWYQRTFSKQRNFKLCEEKNNSKGWRHPLPKKKKIHCDLATCTCAFSVNALAKFGHCQSFISGHIIFTNSVSIKTSGFVLCMKMVMVLFANKRNY